jgi:hypothetical protein
MARHRSWDYSFSTGFLDHTPTHTTLGRTPLHEGSASHRELCLTTDNNHNRSGSMPPTGFKSTIPANKRPYSHALNCAATGIGSLCSIPSDLLGVIQFFKIPDCTVNGIEQRNGLNWWTNYFIIILVTINSSSPIPVACGLWLGSSAYSFLGPRIRISLGAWMSVCCIYCVLYGTAHDH